MVCSTFAPFGFHNFSVKPCHQLCLRSHLAFIYFERNLMASHTKPFISITTSNDCFQQHFLHILFQVPLQQVLSQQIRSLLSFSPSSKLPSSYISSPFSDQSATLKLSAPLSLLKLLVVLSCLIVVSIRI